MNPETMEKYINAIPFVSAAYAVCWGLIGLYIVILGGRVAALINTNSHAIQKEGEQ